jgi:quercetin dioxygenase-like cupin family protein
MSHLKVEHWNEELNGSPTEQRWREHLALEGFASITRYDYPPGAAFPSHTHPIDKIAVVLSGTFRFQMYGEAVDLTAGMAIFVPKGATHAAKVIGDHTVISLDAVMEP